MLGVTLIFFLPLSVLVASHDVVSKLFQWATLFYRSNDNLWSYVVSLQNAECTEFDGKFKTFITCVCVYIYIYIDLNYNEKCLGMNTFSIMH